MGPAEHIDAIIAHVNRYLGPTDRLFHEVEADALHIDVHVAEPTRRRPYFSLVTSGMSDWLMPVPIPDRPTRLELVAILPQDWQVSGVAFADPRWGWPANQLRAFAKVPIRNNTWVGIGHTMALAVPPAPFAPNTELCATAIIPVLTAPDGFDTLAIDRQTRIGFLATLPIYREELDLIRNAGYEAFVDRFMAARLDDIVRPARRNLCR